MQATNIQFSALSARKSVGESIRKYEAGFPVLRELFQNADDAEATRFRVLLVEEAPAGDPRAAFGLSLLTGPALIVANSGPFRTEHAEAIRTYRSSSKPGNGAVGRFGLGLASVFNWCESFFYFSHGNDAEALTDPAGYVSPGAPAFWPDWYTQSTNANANQVATVTEWLRKATWPQDQQVTTAVYFWLPLRWARAKTEQNGERSFLTEACPGDNVPAFAEELRGHWPELWRLLAGSRHLKEVGLSVPNQSHLARLTRIQNRLNHDCPQGENIDLNVSVDTQIYHVRGFQRTFDDVRELKGEPNWPKVDSETGGAATPVDVHPHVGVWTISPDQPAQNADSISAAWATYFPLGNRDPGDDALEIVVHLSAFVDDGRRGFTADGAPGAAVEKRWNHKLVECVLPLLPAAIHPALGADHDGQRAVHVVAALKGLAEEPDAKWGKLGFDTLVGQKESLARCLTGLTALTGEGRWSYGLVPRDAAVLKVAAEDVQQSVPLLLRLLGSLVAAPTEEGAAPLFVVDEHRPIIGELSQARPPAIAQRIWRAADADIRARGPALGLTSTDGSALGALAKHIGEWNKDGHVGFTWVPALIVGPEGTERWCRRARRADAGWTGFPPATFTVKELAQAPHLARQLSAALGSDVTLLDDAVAALVGIPQSQLAPAQVRAFLGPEAPPQANWGTEKARGELFVTLARDLHNFSPAERRGLRRLLIGDWSLADNTPLVAPGDTCDERLFNLMTAAGAATVPGEPLDQLNSRQKRELGLSTKVSEQELVRLLESRPDETLMGPDLLHQLSDLPPECRERILGFADDAHFARLPLHEVVDAGCGSLVRRRLLPRDAALEPFRGNLSAGAPLILQAECEQVAARQRRLGGAALTAQEVLAVVTGPGVARNFPRAKAILWCLNNDAQRSDLKEQLLRGDRANIEWVPLAGGGFARLGRVFSLPADIAQRLPDAGVVSLDWVSGPLRDRVGNYIARGATAAAILAPLIAAQHGSLGELATIGERHFRAVFENASGVAARPALSAPCLVAAIFAIDAECGRELLESEVLRQPLDVGRRNAFLRALTADAPPTEAAVAAVLCLLRTLPENERRDALEGVRLPSEAGNWEPVDHLFVTEVVLPAERQLRDDARTALRLNPGGAENADRDQAVEAAGLFPGWDTDAVSTNLLGVLWLLLGQHDFAQPRLGPDYAPVCQMLRQQLVRRADLVETVFFLGPREPAWRMHELLGLPPPPSARAPLAQDDFAARRDDALKLGMRLTTMLTRIGPPAAAAAVEPLYPLPGGGLQLRNVRGDLVLLPDGRRAHGLLTPRAEGGLFFSGVAAGPPPGREQAHRLLDAAAKLLWRGLGEDTVLAGLLASIEDAGTNTIEKVRKKLLSDFGRMSAFGAHLPEVARLVNQIHGMSLLTTDAVPKKQELDALQCMLQRNEQALIDWLCVQLKDWGYDTASVPFELMQNADDACLQLARLGCNDVPEVVVIDAGQDRPLRFVHAGRGIGQMMSPAGNRGDEAWAADLLFMLTPLGSSKVPDAHGDRHATGQFGLGFKSVFLACDRPVVQSYPLGRFEIQATCLPVRLEGVQDAVDLDRRFPAAFRDRLTRFELPLREEVTTAQVLERFRTLLPILLLFTRHVRSCLMHTDAGVEEVRPPLQRLDATGELHFLDAGDLGRAVVFGANPAHRVVLWVDEHGPRRARQPTFWNLAPTRLCEDGPFCFNAPFALHTGRTGLDDHADRHLQVAQELGRVLGEGLMRLLGFAGAPAAEPESAWTALERLLGPREPTEFLANLWSVSPRRAPVGAGVPESTRDTILLGARNSDTAGALGLVALAGGIPDSLTAPRRLQRLDQLKHRRRGLLAHGDVFDAVKQALGAGETGWIDEAVYERLRELGGLQVPGLETRDLASLLTRATPEGVARPEVANAMGRPCVRRVFGEELRWKEEMRRLEELLPRLRFVNANGVPRESRYLKELELHPRYNDDGRWFFGHCSWLGELRRVRRADADAPEEAPMPARREMAQGPDLQLPLVGADDFERVANWLTQVGVEDAFLPLIPDGLLDAQEDDNPARLLEGIRLAWPRILVPAVLARIDDLYPGWLPRRRSGRRWQQFVERVGLPETLAPFATYGVAPQRGDLELGSIAELYDYQERAVSDALAALNEEESRAFVSLPTGAGKTRVGLEIVRRVLVGSESPCRVLWLAPTQELLDQAADAFPAVWNRGLRDRPDEAASLTSVTWLKDPDVDTLEDYALEDRHVVVFRTNQGADQNPNPFTGGLDLLVVDEAHHALDQVMRIQENVDAERIVGLSATPVRGGLEVRDDNARLHGFFGRPLRNDVLGRGPRIVLEERGVIARPNFVEAPQFRDFRPGDPEWDAYGDFTDAYVERATSRTDALQRVAGVISEIHGRGERSLVFTASRLHSERLWWYVRRELLQAGHDPTGVEVIDSKTPMWRRRDIVQRFVQDGTIMHLLNVGVLTHGFDAPGLRNVVIARPTMSPIKYQQMIGRGLRGNGEPQAECRVYDLFRGAFHGQDFFRDIDALIAGYARLVPPPLEDR